MKNNITYIIIVVLTVICVLSINKCTHMKNKYEQLETIYLNNIKASLDSINTYYDKKLKEYISEKHSYILNDIKDLKQYNKELYNDLKNIKNIVAAINSGININLPSQNSITNIYYRDTVDTNKYIIPWSFKYKDDGLFQYIYGKTNFNIKNSKLFNISSSLDTNIILINLKYTITNEKNNYIVKAYTPSPYIKFNELDGVLIIDKPKMKRFSIGPTFCFGINNYNNDIKFGWNVGIGVTYALFKF